MTAVVSTSAVTFIHVSLKVSHAMTCPAIQNICTILISARDENWPLVQCTESGRRFAELHDPQSRKVQRLRAAPEDFCCAHAVRKRRIAASRPPRDLLAEQGGEAEPETRVVGHGWRSVEMPISVLQRGGGVQNRIKSSSVRQLASHQPVGCP